MSPLYFKFQSISYPLSLIILPQSLIPGHDFLLSFPLPCLVPVFPFCFVPHYSCLHAMPKLFKSPLLGVLALITCVIGILGAFGQPAVTVSGPGQAEGWAAYVDHLSAIGKTQDGLKQVLQYNYTLPKEQVRMQHLGMRNWTDFQAVPKNPNAKNPLKEFLLIWRAAHPARARHCALLATPRAWQVPAKILR